MHCGHSPDDADERARDDVEGVVVVVLDPGERDPEGEDEDPELDVGLHCS